MENDASYCVPSAQPFVGCSPYPGGPAHCSAQNQRHGLHVNDDYYSSSTLPFFSASECCSNGAFSELLLLLLGRVLMFMTAC